mgnify:CR=1 FL=1
MTSRRNLLFTLGALPAGQLKSFPVKAAAVETHEIVIVGAGSAGLFTAVSAFEAGMRDILVIDKNPTPFLCSSSYSAGVVNASGTKAQAAAGIKDTGNIANFAAEIMASGHGTNDAGLVGLFAENAYKAVDWMVEHGVEFTLHPNSSFHIMRMHSNDRSRGTRYVEVLFRQARAYGIKIQMNAQATELITDPENTTVLGVRVRTAAGNKEVRARKAVVLACGGFCGDTHLIDTLIPDFKGALTFASPSSRGEGHLMATKIGADVRLMSYAGVYAYGFAANKETRRGLIFRGHVMNLYGSVSVDADARRFVNDDENATAVSQVMHRRGMRRVFQVATREQLQSFMQHDASQVIGWNRSRFELELKEQKRFIVSAETIRELARKMGLDPVALDNTLKRYNGFVKANKDEDFGRRYMRGTFEKGPYFGFVCEPVVGISVGGLTVNKNLQVMNKKGTAIGNLYAIGEIVGGLHGTTYVGGNSLGAALALGQWLGASLAHKC